MSSLEKVRPGIRPLFLSQKMAAKDPEKKMPSTAANATTLVPKSAVSLAIQLSAHWAFCVTQGIVSTALKRKSLHMKEITVLL